MGSKPERACGAGAAGGGDEPKEAVMGKDFVGGLARAKAKEQSNYPQGRSGGGTKKLAGPVKSVAHNPVKSGGINRATKS